MVFNIETVDYFTEFGWGHLLNPFEAHGLGQLHQEFRELIGGHLLGAKGVVDRPGS